MALFRRTELKRPRWALTTYVLFNEDADCRPSGQIGQYLLSIPTEKNMRYHLQAAAQRVEISYGALNFLNVPKSVGVHSYIRPLTCWHIAQYMNAESQKNSTISKEDEIWKEFVWSSRFQQNGLVASRNAVVFLLQPVFFLFQGCKEKIHAHPRSL